ncbi:MAG: hypothetical protein CMH54_12325 [Myxococcales bacterium]|nr:hypothetical protein [Myxococcales bacterium]
MKQIFLVLLSLLFATTANAQVLFEETFDGDTNNLATFITDDGGTSDDVWVGFYCSQNPFGGDRWRTDRSGGVMAKSDDGCCGSNCNYAVYSNCGSSDPLDNHITIGSKEWDNYRYQVRFRNSDNDTMGVVFRYQNTGNFLMFIMSNDRAPVPLDTCAEDVEGSWLVRVAQTNPEEPGISEIIAGTNSSYDEDEVHLLTVEVEYAQIRVWLDGDLPTGSEPENLIFDVEDDDLPENLFRGQIGLFAFDNGTSQGPCGAENACWFDDIRVTTLGGSTGPVDIDTDEDGILDNDDNCPDTPNPLQRDLDEDGKGDACDDDIDGDQISNDEELEVGLDPKDADSDDDGVLDGEEADWDQDSDGDGKINAQDFDSDNDGVNDGAEAGVPSPGPFTDTEKGNFTPDADPTTTTDPTDADTDGDGYSDGEEDLNGNGAVDSGESNPNDPDSTPGNPTVKPPTNPPTTGTSENLPAPAPSATFTPGPVDGGSLETSTGCTRGPVPIHNGLTWILMALCFAMAVRFRLTRG